jgi:hypothetical protein
MSPAIRVFAYRTTGGRQSFIDLRNSGSEGKVLIRGELHGEGFDFNIPSSPGSRELYIGDTLRLESFLVRRLALWVRRRVGFLAYRSRRG